MYFIFLFSYEWRGALTFTLLFLYSISNIETKDVCDTYNEVDEVSNKSFIQFCKTYSNLLIEQVNISDYFSVIVKIVFVIFVNLILFFN